MGAAVPDSQSLSGKIDSEDFKMVADRVIDSWGGNHALDGAPAHDGVALGERSRGQYQRKQKEFFHECFLFV